eukprot:3941989-Rhodomonas_salina.6
MAVPDIAQSDSRALYATSVPDIAYQACRMIGMCHSTIVRSSEMVLVVAQPRSVPLHSKRKPRPVPDIA